MKMTLMINELRKVKVTDINELVFIDDEVGTKLIVNDQVVIDIKFSSADDRARVIREFNSSLEALAAGFARGQRF